MNNRSSLGYQQGIDLKQTNTLQIGYLQCISNPNTSPGRSLAGYVLEMEPAGSLQNTRTHTLADTGLVFQQPADTGQHVRRPSSFVLAVGPSFISVRVVSVGNSSPLANIAAKVPSSVRRRQFVSQAPGSRFLRCLYIATMLY